MYSHPERDVKATGLDALRALGMSDDEITKFVTTTGLPCLNANELTLYSGPHPCLRAYIPGERTHSGSMAEFPLPDSNSPSFQRAVAALPQGATKWSHSSSPDNFLWDDEARTWHRHHEHSGAIHLAVIELTVGGGALWFLGKLADAYVSRIADHLAETTYKAAKHIKLRRSPSSDCVIIKAPGDTTMIVLPEDLTDEAREAFIDLDPTAEGIRGKILYWEQDEHAWVPGDHLPPDQSVPKFVISDETSDFM